MHAEHPFSRGNGFIISPPRTQIVPKPYTPSAPVRSSERALYIKENISHTAKACCEYSKHRLRTLLSSTLSCAVAISCAVVFFKFFTFGTGIYHGGRQIGVAQGEKEFFAALSAAQTIAEEEGSYLKSTDFITFPAPTLRSKVADESALRDRLLLCSGKFRSACTLYCGGSAVFSAENEQIAAEVVEEYISSYSMNGDATPSAELTFRTAVMPSREVSSKEACARILSDSNSLSVISVVTASSLAEVPFETQTRQDENLYIGETVTVTEGKVGTAHIQSETVYENGAQQSSRILSKDVIVSPVARVVRVGTKYKEVLKTGLSYPLQGIISSPFGARWGRTHEGLDIAVSEGTAVAAAECGTVCYTNENAGGYGKLVRIDHGYGVKTAYAHLSKIEVTVGQKVAAGSTIALSGNTGRSTGPHLHFEVIHNDTPLDPLLYLKK